MINVIVSYKNPDNDYSPIRSLEVKGHANSAPHGKDLVCAAVSAITVGGANAIMEQVNKDYHPDLDITIEEGHVMFELNGIYVQESSDIQKTVKTILIMLKTIKENYPDFIKITEK